MGITSGIIRRKVFFRAWIILCMLLNAVTPQSTNDGRLSSCELESLVNQLINPTTEYQMHATALRNQLRNILQNDKQQTIQSLDDSGDYYNDDKRSVSSLARSGIIPSYGKRYLGALARSGMAMKQADSYKRSLANLAKNGQLPTPEPDEAGTDAVPPQWNEKRNLGSLAKSGGLTSGKRNIGTLARDYQLPSNAGKRNLASLARIGLVPKRNLAALARLNSFYQAEKRNLGALKNSPVHGSRQKRDNMYLTDDYEGPEDFIQNDSIDYEDLKNTLNRLYGGPYEEKRFLGSLAKNGWFRNVDKRNIGSIARLGLLRTDLNRYGNSNSRDSYRQQEQKRHIGALARSDTSPNKSAYDNPPRSYVDDAVISAAKNIEANLVGEHQDHQIGVHHPDLQHYIGEVYGQQQPEILISKQQQKPTNYYDNLKLSFNNKNQNQNQNQVLNLLDNNNDDDDDNNNNNYIYDFNDENVCAQRLNLMLDILGNIEDSSIDNKFN